MAEEGGFAAYGPRIGEIGLELARQIGKVFRGTKIADIPVEQPTKFELVINLKTANAPVEDVAPVRNSPAAANGAADADIAPSIQDASANPMNNAPEARIEESISAPNAAATGSPATNDAIPDASAVHASVSSESIAQNFAPIPRQFGTPMDDAAERSVQEEHTPPASKPSASTATSSQADAVIGAARKVGARHRNSLPRPRLFVEVHGCGGGKLDRGSRVGSFRFRQYPVERDHFSAAQPVPCPDPPRPLHRGPRRSPNPGPALSCQLLHPLQYVRVGTH